MKQSQGPGSAAKEASELERVLGALRDEPLLLRDVERQAQLETRLLESIDAALQGAPHVERSASPVAEELDHVGAALRAGRARLKPLPAIGARRRQSAEHTADAVLTSGKRRWLGALLLAAGAGLALSSLPSLLSTPPSITAEQPRAAPRRPVEPSAPVAPPPAPLEAPQRPAAAIMAGERPQPRKEVAPPPTEQPRSELPLPSASEATPGPGGSVSTLARENQLFEAAAAAERGGNLEEAVATLNRLLTAHPGSPLAQQAMVRRFRALQRAGRLAEAATAADAYLKAYPSGFAQAEAREALQGERPASER